MTIGEHIERLAKDKKMNLHELAVEAKIPYSTLYSIVKRKSNRVDSNTLKKIYDALGVPWQMKAIQDDFPNAWIWESYGDSVELVVMDKQETAALNVGRLFNTDDPVVLKAAKAASNFTTKQYNSQGYSFSNDECTMISAFNKLNAEGQAVAIERVEELAEIPKYQKQEPQEDK